MRFFEITNNEVFLKVLGVPLQDFALPIALVGVIIALLSAREARRANILNKLPIVVLGFGKEEKLIINNIGNSPASSIVVDPFYEIGVDPLSHQAFTNKMIFKKHGLLLQKTSEELEYRIDGDGGFPDWTHYSITTAARDMTFYVRYKDMSGYKYMMKVIIKARDPQRSHIRNEIKHVSRPIKIGLFVIIRYWLLRMIEIGLVRIRRHKLKMELSKRDES